MSERAAVVVVGAGAAGLVAASEIAAAGHAVQVLEAAEAPGGRLRTDLVDGFRLDRGFQILLTGYPEVRRTLDLPSLDLCRFRPGAMVRRGGRWQRLSDPLRNPRQALSTLFSPLGSLRDKLLVQYLRRQAARGTLDDLFARPATSTLRRLVGLGFSSRFIDSFLRPFLGGIFLERDLVTSSRMLEFVWRMFAAGEATVPALGMQAISDQLAARLPGGCLQLQTAVQAVAPGRVTLAAGSVLTCQQVVLATPAPVTAAWLGWPVPQWRAVTCLYFAAAAAPLDEPLLVLNGEDGGIVNNLHVASAVSPAVAPEGQALISATVLGERPEDDPTLAALVQGELRGWFGEAVDSWRLLRIYRLPLALPDQRPHGWQPGEVPAGIHLAGDWTRHGSLQGALESGRAAAAATLAALSSR